MNPEIHRQLYTVLAQLYPTLIDLRRIAFDAGMPLERVPLDSSALNDWSMVVHEAAKQQGVAALLDVARREYGQSRELMAAIAAFEESNQQMRASTLPASNTHLLNFTRELTLPQQQAIEIELGQRIGRVIHLPVHFDNARPYGPKCVAIAEQIGLTSTEWGTLPIIVNPPGFVPGALCLLSELHGRMGYFPSMVRLRPIDNSNPQRFELAEVMNLQALRNAANGRGKR